MKKGKIAILTGGGDCPGINAVIRAVAKKAILEFDMDVIGIADGYDGMINEQYRKLSYDDISGIINLSGTILGTSNKANPYEVPVKKDGKLVFEDRSDAAIATIKKMGVDCLICIGGDGTLSISNRLSKEGVSVVGIPKTIDNDIRGTDITFGFDSAVYIATEGLDRIRTTAQSHHRVMIVEVMGRTAGWIALHAGIASGAEIILIPEIPYQIDAIVAEITKRKKNGRRFTVIVVAEGAKAKGGSVSVQRIVKDSHEQVRLGGIGFVLGNQLEKATEIETRTVVMGHLLRGGVPTPFDRVLATKLGTSAMDLVQRKRFGYMVGVKGNEIIDVPLEEVGKGPRHVTPDEFLVRTARSVGTCFGDR